MTTRKGNLFKLLSLAGMALGAIGTLLTNWASDKELDRMIDEKIEDRLADYENEKNNEES